MSQTINPELLTAAIRRAIDEEINRTADEATEEVIKRIREAVRKRLGGIACGLLGQYEVYEDRRRLIITVNLKDDTQ